MLRDVYAENVFRECTAAIARLDQSMLLSDEQKAEEP